MASRRKQNARNQRLAPTLLAALSATLCLFLPASDVFADDEATAVEASFNFKDAPADVVLSTLEQLFDVQFAVSVKLEPNLSLDSRGVVGIDRMVELVDSSLKPQGAVAQRDGDVVRIAPLSLTAAKVEMIRLKNADPGEVAKVINEMFQTPDLLRETTAQNAEMVRKLMEQLETHASSVLAGQMQVSAVAYPRLKAVIVRAPEISLPLIRQFIVDELDQPGPPTPKPKPKPKPEPKPKPPPDKKRIYRLNYVPANYVADTARKLSKISPYVEPRLNALILTTNKYEQFDQLQELIDLLDIPDSVETETYHVTLNNAKADEVRKTLESLFRRTRELPFTTEGLMELTADEAQEATSALAAAGVPERVVDLFVAGGLGVPYGDVQVIADKANNALLIRTHPRNFDRILRLIRQLDQARGQVMIKVFIGEVTLDNTTETGVDFLYQDIDNDRVQRTGLNFNVEATATGLSYTFISDNVDAFIRALQASTRVDVISRPQVLTLDNTPAQIEFGKRVPLLQTTQITSDGTVNSTVRYEDVVTKLDVTPHLNAAGFIRMDIVQTIDDVSSDTFAITEQLAPRILTTRKARTEVQVRDGQTVCLGGFIGDTIDETEQKIPLLGDIPLLGRAFSSVKKTRVKTELLIFITPYILKTPEALLSMTNQVRTRMSTTPLRDRPAQELYYQDAPEENPHRGWQRSSRRYTIPESARRKWMEGQSSSQTSPASPTAEAATPKPAQP
jgi:type II secretory pathway component GspD/PulD (secretin)